ncbi:MAG: hypothetical protein GY749_46930 [Desulfobacteraceae bacterium]|nr:hypothetical protein [Desulfobacteraceae bacterium]
MTDPFNVSYSTLDSLMHSLNNALNQPDNTLSDHSLQDVISYADNSGLHDSFHNLLDSALDSVNYEQRNNLNHQEMKDLIQPLSEQNHNIHHDSGYVHLHSSSCRHYVTMNQYGMFYNENMSYIGYVKQHSIYTDNQVYVGYVGTAGGIYDSNNTKVGHVDSCGNVYNTAGEKIYHTNGDIVSGGAYLLLIYLEGVN